MIQCIECGYRNRLGTLFCEECGRKLIGMTSAPSTVATPPPQLTTAQMKEAAVPSASPTPLPSEASRPPIWSTAQLTSKSSIRLRFPDTARSIELPHSDKLVVGRVDQGSSAQPDIDLVPYGALEHGVSRFHASFEVRHDTLIICDLGSSNGTYVNNLRLPPHQPHLLRDGDEIRFGKLVTHVHFH